MLQQLVSAETPNKDPRRGLSAAADSRDKRARGRVSQKLIHLSQRCWKKPDVWCNCKSLGVVGSTLEGLDYAKKCPSKPVLGKMRKAEAAAWSTTAFQAAAQLYAFSGSRVKAHCAATVTSCACRPTPQSYVGTDPSPTLTVMRGMFFLPW